MTRLERYSALVMLANGAIGCLISLISAAAHQSVTRLLDSPPWVSLLGLVCGILALRGKASSMIGLIGGLVYYALQVASYYAKDFQFSLKSAFNLGYVVQLQGGTLVLNVAAIAGMAVIAFILQQRFIEKKFA